ncbi:MAG: hypothetical protein HC847_15635 [Hydrococcus sp. RU_2_2]|jgi:hypothetical protein|nr:hypothetical protein [Hydrococcus sp. RU_2_2]NJP19102.1 hypothetical protein [Hydrococcus sp. CRU_1_1]NJQ97702.1 hypothetical protein [Hydrococcus sp. CSU_1_8]
MWGFDWFNHNFSVRSLVVLTLISGSIWLAAIDNSDRSRFADLAYFGVGGYFGQLVPRRKE